MKRFIKSTLTLSTALLLSLCSTLAVHAVPPSYTGGLDDLEFPEDAGLGGNLNAFFTGGVGAFLSYSVSSVPSNILFVNLTGQGGANIQIIGQPDQFGPFSFDLTVTDFANQSITHTVTGEIIGSPDAPEVFNPIPFNNLSEDDGALPSINLLDHFRDVDGDTLGFIIDSQTNPAAIDVVLNGNFLDIQTIPNAHGNNNVRVCANDGVHAQICTDAGFFVDEVNDPPVLIGSLGSISTPEDTPGTLTIDLGTIFADVDSTIFYTLLPSPTGIVNAQTAGDDLELTLIPNANGVVTLVVDASDGLSPGISDTLTIDVVAVNDLPLVTQELGSRTFAEDQTGMAPIDLNNHFSDADGEALTYTLTETVPGVINASIGGSLLTFASIADGSGTTEFEVTAEDASGATATSTLTVIVQEINDAPVKTGSIGVVTIDEDQSAGLPTFDLNTIYDDVDSPSLFYTVVSINPGGVVNASVSGSILSFDTIQDQSGTATVLINVSDGAASAPAESVSVVVNPINDVPVVNQPLAPVTIAEDTGSAVVSLVNAFSDVDLDSLSYSVASANPSGLVNATITGSTLTVDVVPDAFGSVTLTIEAIDGGTQPASTTLTVDITPVEDPPVVIAPINDISILEDQAISFITLDSVFSDPDGDALSYVVSSVTPTGILQANVSAGELRLLPIANAHGNVIVTVTATDPSGSSASDTVLVEIAPVNDAPFVIEPAPVSIEEDTNGVQTQDATAWFDDVDLPFDSLGYSIVGVTGDPVFAAGSVGISAAGTVTYELELNQSGFSDITVEVVDSAGETAETTLRVIVNPVNDPPFEIAPLPTQVTQEDLGAPQFSLAGVFGDDDIGFTGDVLTFSVTSGAASLLGNFSISGDNLVLTQAPNENGTATVVVTATDTEFATATTTVTVEVTPVNDGPTASPSAPTLVQIREDDPISFLPIGGLEIFFDDVDLTREGDSFSFQIVGGGTSPLFDAIGVTGNHLELDPTLNAVGFHTVQVVATDQGGLQSPPVDVPLEVLLVIVDAFDDVFTIAEGETDPAAQLIDVLANDTFGDPPTLIISAGITLDLGVAGIFEGASESPPTSLRDSSGVDFLAPNGSVEVVAGGTQVRYIPKDNYNGPDFFTYTIQDGDGDTSTARVDIVITADNDAPEAAVPPQFTMPQAGTLNVLAEGGLLSTAFDPENDTLDVIYLTTPDPLATLSFIPNADGSFQFTPLPGFSGDLSFDIRYRENATPNNLESATVTVLITVAPTPPPPSAPPAGEVEFDMQLSDVPLEDAISTEANVLVVMDDSGSMDWDMMTDQLAGLVLLDNFGGLRASNIRGRGTYYYYIYDLPTNLFSTRPVAPVQAEIDAEAGPGGDFFNNQHGVWRLRNPQFNTIYYNPEIEYQPWRGLDRNNLDFGNVNPAAAPLDPFQVNSPTIDLTATHSWNSTAVPLFRNVTTGRKTVVNNNVYLPYYWTTTAVGPDRPEWDERGTQVVIQGPGPLPNSKYPGGISRLDCSVDDGNPLECTLEQELQNFANWFSYYRAREYTAKAALGRAIAQTTNLRMGYAVLNDSNDREEIESLNSSFRTGHKAELLEQLYATTSNGGTPLRRALSRAGRHFECEAGDSFGSTTSSSPGSPACPVLPVPEGQCQNNFTLLFSDGTWNGSTSDINSADRQNTDADAASNGAENTAFDGGVFADNITGSLADIAMHFYERDLHPTLEDGVPTSARDINLAPAGSFLNEDEVMHQHMKTYTVGFGVTGAIELADLPNSGVNPGTGLPVINFSQPFNWGDPFNSNDAKIDDMLHAALNGRGQFLQANNPVLLAQAFQDAFEEFSDGSVSVSAVAFGSTQLRAGTVQYRGFFNLRFNTGDLETTLLLDEQTGLPPANPLVWSAADQLQGVNPNTRRIFTFDRQTFNGIPFRHADLNSDQQAMLSLLEVGYLRGDQSFEEPLGPFRARESVLGDIVNSAPRAIGRPQAIRRDRAPFPTNQLYSDFVAANENRRRVVYVGANDGMLHAFDGGFEDQTPNDNGTGNELFAFVPNKLIDSSQRFNNDLDQLPSLVYSHRFFVDGTPTIEDVFIRPNGNGVQTWRTLLAGGLRGGGKGYYALDITDPDFIATSEVNAAQSVLWEFTDADDTYPIDLNGVPEGGAVGAITDAAGLPVTDLGYTYSEPRIVLTNVDGTGAPAQKKWAVVFGNGYNSTAGIAKLFVLFVDDGVNGWQNGDFVKVNTGNGTIGTNPANPATNDPAAGIPNGLGQPSLIDTNLDGIADFAYAGDLQGHMYRFEIGDSDPSNWKAVQIFTASFDGSTSTRQAITAAPLVRKHPTQEGYIVTFGTGSYITEQDGISTDIESIYGIWDRFEAAPPTADAASKLTLLTEQTITNIADETAGVPVLRIVSRNSVDYIAGNTPTSNYGWFIDLDPVRASTTVQGNPNPDTGGLAPPNPQYPGERAIRRIIPRATALIITTVIPRDGNSCFRAPPGSLFFIDALTGGDPNRPVVDFDNDGVIDSNDLITIGGEQYTAGVLFEGEGSLVDPSILLGDGEIDFLIVNNSHSGSGTGAGGLFGNGTSNGPGTGVIGDGDRKTGRLSWWELTNE